MKKKVLLTGLILYIIGGEVLQSAQSLLYIIS